MRGQENLAWLTSIEQSHTVWIVIILFQFHKRKIVFRAGKDDVVMIVIDVITVGVVFCHCWSEDVFITTIECLNANCTKITWWSKTNIFHQTFKQTFRKPWSSLSCIASRDVFLFWMNFHYNHLVVFVFSQELHKHHSTTLLSVVKCRHQRGAGVTIGRAALHSGQFVERR